MTRSKKSWPRDIGEMHDMMDMHLWKENADSYQKVNLMKLRMRMLTEEYAETMDAYLQGDVEEMIDGLIDIMVIATGTLDIAGVDANKAWDQVMEANLAKKVGIKPGRPNPLGLPDLIKPEGWTSPSHEDNHGDMKDYL